MKDKYLKFTTLLTSIMRNIRRITADTVAHYDIKRSYAPIIYFLYKNGPLSAAKLCRLCGEDKANVSRTLHALEDEGFVTREVRGGARSSVRMMLTEEGNEIGAYFSAKVSEAVALATEGLEPEDVAVMYRALEGIDGNLKCAASQKDGTEAE